MFHRPTAPQIAFPQSREDWAALSAEQCSMIAQTKPERTVASFHHYNTLPTGESILASALLVKPKLTTRLFEDTFADDATSRDLRGFVAPLIAHFAPEFFLREKPHFEVLGHPDFDQWIDDADSAMRQRHAKPLQGARPDAQTVLGHASAGEATQYFQLTQSPSR